METEGRGVRVCDARGHQEGRATPASSSRVVFLLPSRFTTGDAAPDPSL